MFNAMMDGIKEESVGALFNLEVQIQENPIVEEAVDAHAEPAAIGPVGSVPAGAGPAGPAQGGRGQGGPAFDGQPTRNNGAMPGGGTVGGGTPGGAAQPGAAGGAGGAGGRAGAGTRAPGRHRSGATASRRSGGSRGTDRGETMAGGPASGNQPGSPIPAGLTPPRRSGQLRYTAPSVDGGTHVESHTEGAPGGDFAHVGRNDPCPCGSGRKFKRCHGDPRTRAGD